MNNSPERHVIGSWKNGRRADALEIRWTPRSMGSSQWAIKWLFIYSLANLPFWIIEEERMRSNDYPSLVMAQVKIVSCFVSTLIMQPLLMMHLKCGCRWPVMIHRRRSCWLWWWEWWMQDTSPSSSCSPLTTIIINVQTLKYHQVLQQAIKWGILWVPCRR